MSKPSQTSPLMSIAFRFGAILVAALVSPAASAEILDVTGDGRWLPGEDPTDDDACEYNLRMDPLFPIIHGVAHDDDVFAFDERQCVPLPVPLRLNQFSADVAALHPDWVAAGEIPAGVVVSSHYVHALPATPPPVTVNYSADFIFANPVIGVAERRNTMNASNYLGCKEAVYPNDCNFEQACGIEPAADTVTIPATNTVRIDFETHEYGDRIRVITTC